MNRRRVVEQPGPFSWSRSRPGPSRPRLRLRSTNLPMTSRHLKLHERLPGPSLSSRQSCRCQWCLLAVTRKLRVTARENVKAPMPGLTVSRPCHESLSSPTGNLVRSQPPAGSATVYCGAAGGGAGDSDTPAQFIA